MSDLISKLTIASLLAVLALAGVYYGKLPSKIPIHFNVIGQPDSWGHKRGIFILPVLGLILFANLTFASQLFDKKMTKGKAQNNPELEKAVIKNLNIVLGLGITYSTVAHLMVSLNRWEGLGHYYLILFMSAILVGMAIPIVQHTTKNKTV